MQKFYRLNQYIQGSEFRVLDEKSRQVGILSRDQALKKAYELGLDLVEISQAAKPPVVKIIDFKKFKYLEAKRERQIKKGAREVETKEIRLRPFIANHDFEVRINKGKEFIKHGHRLKLSIKFQGREFAKKEFGFKIINQYIEHLKEEATIQVAPHFEGKILAAILAPSVKKNAKTENKKSS